MFFDPEKKGPKPRHRTHFREPSFRLGPSQTSQRLPCDRRSGLQRGPFRVLERAQTLTPHCIELSIRWNAMGQSLFFTTLKRKTQDTIFLLFRPWRRSHDSEASNKIPTMDADASREARHAVLVHLRSQQLNTPTIKHVQSTNQINKYILDRCALSFIPPSSAYVQLSTSVSTATSDKRSASTQRGSRTQSRKRKKQQCFRAEFDDLDVHSSQAETRVHAPLGSHV